MKELEARIFELETLQSNQASINNTTSIRIKRLEDFSKSQSDINKRLLKLLETQNKRMAVIEEGYLEMAKKYNEVKEIVENYDK